MGVGRTVRFGCGGWVGLGWVGLVGGCCGVGGVGVDVSVDVVAGAVLIVDEALSPN